MATDDRLMTELRRLWAPTTEAIAPADDCADDQEPRRRIASVPAVMAAGVAIERCRSHLPPFDAIEAPDAGRPGVVRVNCRLCGRFLGYRRPAADLNLGCQD